MGRSLFEPFGDQNPCDKGWANVMNVMLAIVKQQNVTTRKELGNAIAQMKKHNPSKN